MRDPLTPYNNAAGHRGVDTSIAAAALIDKTLPRLQRAVLEVLAAVGAHGATSDEIAQSLGWERHRVRPRTSELRGTKRIVDSGRRRLGANGVNMIVWILPAYAEGGEA